MRGRMNEQTDGDRRQTNWRQDRTADDRAEGWTDGQTGNRRMNSADKYSAKRNDYLLSLFRIKSIYHYTKGAQPATRNQPHDWDHLK